VTYGLTRYGAMWHIADPRHDMLTMCGRRLLPRRLEGGVHPPEKEVCSLCRKRYSARQ
jgi:hypothetical protein